MNLAELYASRRRLQVSAVVDADQIQTIQDYLRRPRNVEIFKVISECIPEPPCEILDLGCGRAFVGEYFARQGYGVICSDLPEVLDILMRDIPVRYLASPDLETGFPEGMYHVVLCHQVIEHLMNDVLLLLNIHDHLAPGGIACISSVNRLQEGDCLLGHVRSYPEFSLANLMIVAGFDLLRDVDFTQAYPDGTEDTAVLVVGRKGGTGE